MFPVRHAIFYWICFIVFLVPLSSQAEELKVKELVTGEKSDFYMSDAAFYKVKAKEKAILFVPGFIFNKESWKNLATQFQEVGVASLAVSAKTPEVVVAGVNFLKKKGYSQISLVGGSSGAAAILQAIPKLSGSVNKVVLLSPVRGDAIDRADIDKLFVASKDERAFSTVDELFNSSSFPKQFKVFDGSAHAQFLFYGTANSELTILITGFIVGQ